VMMKIIKTAESSSPPKKNSYNEALTRSGEIEYSPRAKSVSLFAKHVLLSTTTKKFF
jgi:hypothetical protein